MPSGGHGLLEGLSPRVRSGLRLTGHHSPPTWIISACAERTSSPTSTTGAWTDYLRVCGADIGCRFDRRVRLGLSPRVRSGRPVRRGDAVAGGIISACAERTRSDAASTMPPEDYLRVCGADLEHNGQKLPYTGLSPRVRSGQDQCELLKPGVRIISACAERTSSYSSYRLMYRDYLRVCGADGNRLEGELRQWGLSPRVRSGRDMQPLGVSPCGIISACAERTPSNVSIG